VFSLSLRDVELILAERGVFLTYETVRRWCRKFGESFADSMRRLASADATPGATDATIQVRAAGSTISVGALFHLRSLSPAAASHGGRRLPGSPGRYLQGLASGDVCADGGLIGPGTDRAWPKYVQRAVKVTMPRPSHAAPHFALGWRRYRDSYQSAPVGRRFGHSPSWHYFQLLNVVGFTPGGGATAYNSVPPLQS